MLADKAHQQAQNVLYLPTTGHQSTDGTLWYLCFDVLHEQNQTGIAYDMLMSRTVLITASQC